jgi:ATP-dependent exoDNAse (exonuclease V) alpha subunit
MSKTETEIPKGSYAAGERVKLPAGAEPPFAVFINGVEQNKESYRIEAGEIVFSRPIVKEKVGTGRWLAMYLGLFGTYRKNETIDLQFNRKGKVELRSDLAVVPYAEGDGPS